MRTFIAGLLVAGVAITAAACSATGGTGGTIDGTSWVLKTYDVSGTATPVPAGVRADARFADGQIAGSSGCNVYRAPVTVSGATMTIGTAATTMMACDDARTSLEQAYLANLGKVATFTATSTALTMFDKDGKSILVYDAAAANPLEGEWNVTGYNNGKEAVTSPIAGTTLTAVFTADTVSGNAGCNTYNGSYTIDGSNVTIGPLMSTKMACTDQAASDQETQFLGALQNAATFEQTGAVMTLRAADGATQVTLGAK